MMNYKIVLSGVALGVATLLAAPATAALLFSDSDSFKDILTELTGGPKLSVSRYNGGGTVNDIKLTFSSALRTSGEIVNTAAQAQNFSLSLFAGQYDLVPVAGSPAALPTFSPLTLDSFLGQTIGSQSYVALAPNVSNTFGGFEITGDDSLSITDINAIADFIGTGDITFEPFTQILTLGQGGGGNVDTFVDTVADGTLTIEYFGDPPVTSPTSVPEPGVIGGIVALGALGLSKQLKRQVS